MSVNLVSDPAKARNSGLINDIELVFWPSAVMDQPLAAQIEVAAAGGFDSLAVAPNVIKRAMAAGDTAADIIDRGAERGVKFTQIDGVATWAPLWYPTIHDPATNDAMRERFDIDPEEALDLGQALGMNTVVAVAAFDPGAMPLDDLVRPLADFCDSAQRRGIHVDFEFIPIWAVRDLPAAWKIIQAVDRPNTSITIDTWHLQKGSPDYEGDMALLQTIPGHYLRTIQIADAPRRKVAPTLMEEAAWRTYPGEGEFDILRMIAIIAARGGLKTVGPEIVGHAYAGLSNEEIGRRSGDTTRWAITGAAALLK